MDGVGLGEDDPDKNPFAQARMTFLSSILGERKLMRDIFTQDKDVIETDRASLMRVDACLGVEGIPQSATGQATLLTGLNIARQLGYHEGPKPTRPVIEIMSQGTIFSQLLENNKKIALLNAYPPRYFHSIERGYRIPGVFALAAREAGMQLKTKDDLYTGDAISADFTGEGWRSMLGFADTPVISHEQAGERLAALANGFDLAVFEFWLTDVVGHHQNMQEACMLLEAFDTVLGSMASAWDEDGLIMITSDHGNIEDLSTRRHTLNDVPLLLLGQSEYRDEFITQIMNGQKKRAKPDLSDIAPAINRLFR